MPKNILTLAALILTVALSGPVTGIGSEMEPFGVGRADLGTPIVYIGPEIEPHG